MCHPLILASTEPLPISQYGFDRDNDTGKRMYVQPASDCHDSRVLFPKRFLYWISAQHTGDACGLSGDYADAEQARDQLASFLEHALEYCDDLHVFVALTDHGDSGVTPTRFDSLSPCDIRTWVTWFAPGDLFEILRDD